jgi:NAD(P)H dehydrogenase (quinone)
LRPTFFLKWINWTCVRRDTEGILRLPFADGRYPLVGAEELDYYGIAEKVQHALGLPVRYEPIDIPVFAASQTAHGATPFLVQHLSHVAQDYRDGIFSGKNNLVEVISGSKPMTVEEYVISNRSKFDTDGRYSVEDVLRPTA